MAAAVGPAAGRMRNSGSPTRNCWRNRSCCFHCYCCCHHLREIEGKKWPFRFGLPSLGSVFSCDPPTCWPAALEILIVRTRLWRQKGLSRVGGRRTEVARSASSSASSERAVGVRVRGWRGRSARRPAQGSARGTAHGPTVHRKRLVHVGTSCSQGKRLRIQNQKINI